MELTDSIRPIPDDIRHSLELLDGDRHFAYLLQAVPPAKKFRAERLAALNTYMQCAGDSGRLTIEMRQYSEGQGRLYTVGRRNSSLQDAPAAEISWSEASVWVFPNEMFDAAEAADIFYFYYRFGSVPEDYSLRPL